jgi:alpha-L-fucosidase
MTALAVVLVLVSGGASAQYEGVEYMWEGNPAVKAKLERWQDLKLGFMVHWGTYSQKGWCESWGLCSEDVDWLSPPEPDYQTYYDTYVGLKSTFDPRGFDPDEWARMAGDAGMRYLVFTTKHHDGFCMFDTQQTDYKITDEGCPFHDHPYADVTKHLFDAFRRRGFMIGAYFSKPDWHVPWYWSPHWQHCGRNVNYRPKAHPEIWEKFCDFTRAQIEELCTSYGPVDILWLDGAWVDPANRDQDIHMDRIAAAARRLQPGLVIVDRWVGGAYENYRTPERRVPEGPLPYPWETCMPMAGAWSYNADDVYKPTRELVHTLVDVVAKGGSLLLNAGADGNGRFHPDAVTRMHELGAWLSVNGDAIYATRPLAPYKEGKTCFTRRRDDGTVYAIYLSHEGETLPTTLLLKEVQALPGEEVRLLGHTEPLRWEAVKRGMRISIPPEVANAPPCEHAWALRLGRVREVDSPLRVSDLDGWRIITPEGAPAAVAYAARELKRLLNESAGIDVTISSSAGNVDRNIRLAVDADLSEEGLVLRVGDESIRIDGGSPRGVLYGVYEFAERYLGVRFLTAGHTYFPPDAASRELPRETHAMTPVFDFRWPYLGETNLHPEFAARLRVNTVAEAESLGGMTGQRLISHSLGEQVPVARYGEEHPEYFALVRGERTLEAFGGGPQPCLTNPDVLDIVTASVMEEMAEHPERRNISVSQTDNDLYCRCDACETINRREGSPAGTQLSFVNAVAGRVAERYPDRYVGTLAYWHTRRPPAHLHPAPNVQVQLANIESCCLHSLVDSTCEANADFLSDLREWCRISDQVYVWSYFTDFRYYDLPFPDLRSIGPNLRLFADLGVRGVFAQSHGSSTSGDMSDLRNYVLARLLWNPYQDGWVLVEEFCRLHYGAAGEEVLGYLVRLHDRAESLGVHPTCFATPEELGLDADFAAEMMERFARARAVAEREGPEYVARVEKASIPAYRAMIEAGAPLGYVGGAVRRVYPHPYENVVADYLRLAEAYGLTAPDERTSTAEFAERLKRDATSGRPAELLENDFWRLVLLPEENGRLVEMTFKPSGVNYLRAYRNNLRFGTFEEWESLLFDENADLAPFDVERVPGGLALRKEGEDGSVHVRRIILDGETIRCVTSVENRGSKPREWRLVVHPEWNAGTDTSDYRQLTSCVRIGDEWRPFNRDMRADRGPDADLLNDGLPGRAMAFYNHVSGYGLLMRYSPENIRKLRTWWVPGYRQINLELETEPVTLAPGENFEISYSFEPWDGVSD